MGGGGGGDHRTPILSGNDWRSGAMTRERALHGGGGGGRGGVWWC